MRKTWIAISAAWLLTGCYGSKPPSELTGDLNQHYRDWPVNEFFAKYGLPAGEFDANDQTHIYRWASSQRYVLPASFHLASYHSTEGNYEVIDTYHGTTETHYCELRIYTDAQDHIQNFALAVDSIGKWSSSRCSELFFYP